MTTVKPEDLPIGPITRIVAPATLAFALPSPSVTSKPHHSNKGKIIGGVIGGVVGLILLLAAIWFLLRWRKRRARTKKGHEELGDTDTAAPTPQQKHSEDRPQIAQVQSAVTVPPGAVTNLTGPRTKEALAPATELGTLPSTTGTPHGTFGHTSTLDDSLRSSVHDTLSPLPNDILSGPSPAVSPPGSSLGHGSYGHGLAVPPATQRPESPLSISTMRHARSPSLSSVLSDYVDASEIAATPISASERRMMEARGEAFYSSAKSVRSMASQRSLRAPSPCRSARYKSLDGAVMDEADLKLLRPVERGESGLFTH